MRKLTAFTILSLNGYYKDENDDISWHNHDEEELEISRENLRSDGTTLLFGRKTYDGFAGFWATDHAFIAFPEISERMSNAEKVVFSRTLSAVTWNNTRLAQYGPAEEIGRLKAADDGGMTLLGSGEIVRQLAFLNLIDDYLLLIDPVILARGAALFDDFGQTLLLTLHKSRQLKSGAMLLHYQAS